MRWFAMFALCACGRVGFDPHGDGGAGDDAFDSSTIDADFGQWTISRTVTVDGVLGGSTGLVDFPVLLRIPPSFDYANAQSNGADLRFILGTTEIPYDIERWNPAGESLVWIGIPSIPANSSAPIVAQMIYGNPLAPIGARPDTVWSEYTSVHHLGDFTDASTHGHLGGQEPGEGLPTATAGVVGDAMRFASAALLLANESDYDFTTSFSLTAWVRVTSVDNAFAGMICKGDASWCLSDSQTASGLRFRASTASGVETAVATNGILDGGWHQVGIQASGTARIMFIDGGVDNSLSGATAMVTDDDSVVFGDNEGSTMSTLFNGSIDEVRIGSIARSIDWVHAEYLVAVDANRVILSNATSL